MTVAVDQAVEESGPRPAARRWHLVVIGLLGLGLALAPALFQMFTRVPPGADMLADFEPYMTSEKLTDFSAELDVIDAAHKDAAAALERLSADQRAQYPSVVTFVEEWPGIDDDMRSMLATMDDNLGNYAGLQALPPFPLFPWFFVLPGLLIAGVAGWILIADRGRPPARGRRVALVVLGVGLIAAPAVFGMFSRAPGGAEMINGFKPFMTEDKVVEIQGYFLTIGAGEGQLRNGLIPDLQAAGDASADEVLPAVQELNEAWPEISGDLAPMVGTMADNVGRFSGLAAMPPFSLFPWFFVLPGLIVVVLAWRSRSIVVAPVPVAEPVAAAVPAAELPAARLRRRRVARIVATTAVVTELVSLFALNLLADPRVETTTTTTRRPPELAAATTPTTTAAPVAPAPSFVPVVVATAPDAPLPTTPPPVATTVPSPPAAPGVPAGPVSAALSCPLPLTEPPTGGGVASLTPLLPLFGPFSAEAFAMLPAFEPLFPLMGPLMVAGQGYLEQMDPAIALLIAIAGPLEDAGFEVLAPFYEPYRQGFLDNEAAIADALAPLGEALAGTPGAGCLPALEALLLANAPATG